MSKRETRLLFVVAVLASLLVGALYGTIQKYAWAAPASPVFGQDALFQMAEMYNARWDSDYSAGCSLIQDVSTQWTIPNVHDTYVIHPVGDSVKVLCGTDPEVSAITFADWIPEGTYSLRFKFDDDHTKCATISGSGTDEAGYVCFLRWNRSL